MYMQPDQFAASAVTQQLMFGSQVKPQVMTMPNNLSAADNDLDEPMSPVDDEDDDMEPLSEEELHQKPSEININAVKDESELRPLLEPTPRKSEREKKAISYDKLNKGAQGSEEEDVNANDSAKDKIKRTDLKK